MTNRPVWFCMTETHSLYTLCQLCRRSLQYLVTEFVRFITHTQHRELSFRSDLEPSNFAIADAVRKTCRGLGITVHHEPVAKEITSRTAQLNQLCSRRVQKPGFWSVRSRRSGKLIFPATHPVYNWALLHSAWLSNRYIVKQGTTAYERSSDRFYSGKLCMYGEFSPALHQNRSKSCTTLVSRHLVGQNVGE